MISATTFLDHHSMRQYARHQRPSDRPNNGAPDLGTFDSGLLFADGFDSGESVNWSATQP